MNLAERFGENLKQARKRAGISQEELAVRASLHRTEIGLVERGERSVRLETAIKLAGAAGVPLAELVAGVEWSPGFSERGRFEATEGDEEGGVIKPSKSHPAKEPTQRIQIQDETELHRTTKSDGVPVGVQRFTVASIEQPRPSQELKPHSTTNWEPLRFVPGPHLLDPLSRQAGCGRFPPGGRRPIVARLRRADGRLYGRPEGSDLRSCEDLQPIFPTGIAMQLAVSVDIGGMERDTPQAEPFFTERTLAAYLAVSDRTIRNWIRRGELPSYKLGASRRIDPADVDAFLEARREEAA